MKIYYPGVLMVPLMLLSMFTLWAMDGFGIIQTGSIWRYWPVTLIATGLEEIYLWAISKTGR